MKEGEGSKIKVKAVPGSSPLRPSLRNIKAVNYHQEYDVSGEVLLQKNSPNADYGDTTNLTRFSSALIDPNRQQQSKRERPKTEIRIRNFKEDMLDRRKVQMFGEYVKYGDEQKNISLIQSLADSRKDLRSTSSERDCKMEQ